MKKKPRPTERGKYRWTPKQGVSPLSTQAATYSPDQVRTVIDTDCQKSNTTQCKRLSEDKTPLSLVSRASSVT